MQANQSATRDKDHITQGQHVLIVEDYAPIREVLRMWLEEDEARYVVSEADRGEDALAILTGPVEKRPALVLLDHYLPDMESTQIQQEMLNQGVDIPVIVITGRSPAQRVIKATQMGAIDFLSKPFEDSSVVLDAVRKGLRQVQMRRENVAAEIPEIDPSEKIIGDDPTMLEIFKTIGKVARSSSTILITGETGTGKTLLAETIHQASERRRAPFLSFHCAGVPETLLEAALFGAEKGAYTGNDKLRIGIFEAANNGTVFLDEIGEMSLATQVKLLKVLQEEHIIVRLGSNDPIRVNVRIIAATNKNLEEEVQRGRFREDLFYRLNVIAIHMPPLRAHRQDIPALVAHFLKIHRHSPTMPEARITAEALAKLTEYDWPGNVRELEAVIQRAVAFSRGDMIMPEHIIFTRSNLEYLTLDIGQRVQAGTPMSAILQEAQTLAIRSALRISDGESSRAADLLSMSAEAFDTLRGELGL
jgi:two-component system response regulator AtoC